MSKNIIHIVCLLFLSFSVLGQDKDVIPKGINKIIFNTNLSEKENIKSIVRVLKENDYTIQKIDSISFQIEIETYFPSFDKTTEVYRGNVIDQFLVKTLDKDSGQVGAKKWVDNNE